MTPLSTHNSVATFGTAQWCCATVPRTEDLERLLQHKDGEAGEAAAVHCGTTCSLHLLLPCCDTESFSVTHWANPHPTLAATLRRKHTRQAESLEPDTQACNPSRKRSLGKAIKNPSVFPFLIYSLQQSKMISFTKLPVYCPVPCGQLAAAAPLLRITFAVAVAAPTEERWGLGNPPQLGKKPAPTRETEARGVTTW